MAREPDAGAPEGRAAPPRTPLTRALIVGTAVALADESGLGGLTMRALAARLGVEAMSLYHHVPGKEALLDAMVDEVFAEIDAPRAGTADWAGELRARSHSAREALLRHRWAVGMMDSRRAAGAATLRHHEAVVACLRTAGFSVDIAAQAFAALDAHLYGFVLQEISLPFGPGADLGALADELIGSLPGELPYLAELAREHTLRPGYTFGDEFDFGLEVLLEGLARRIPAGH